jgi:DNA-binding CsgD family transcriptional regulator/tetratricopeptide (TPR) repeat protein
VTPGGVLTAGSPRFVGRRAELEAVSRSLDFARAGSSRIVVVEGEPGIGKTALLRHSLDGASGFVVLAASGDESETNLDFGVASQLISRSRTEQGGSSNGSRASNGSHTDAPPASPFVVGAELLTTLGELQDDGPVAIVIDDAQWIDASSAGALLFALRRLFADRVCALIATRPLRPSEGQSSWARLLNDAERVQRLVLSGLDTRDVVHLADAEGHPALTLAAAARLRDHTHGHPLYLKTLLRELPDDVVAADHGALPAPHSFSATVLARLTAIGTRAQDLVAAAAVAGPRCTLSLAGEAAGVVDPVGALDEALAAELLALAPGRVPTEIAFVHPLVRAAVYDDLSLTRRRELHLAWAGLTSGAAALAHRIAASPGADDELAGELVATGRHEVAHGALSAGIDHLLLASRVAAGRAAREQALLEAIDYLGIAGDVPRAQRLREAVAACQDSPRRSFALATLNASAGHLPEAIDALVAVTQRPDFALHPELFGPVTSSLAIICAYAGRGAEAVQWAGRALSEPGADVTVEVTATQARALGLSISGRAAEAVAVLDSVSPSRIAPEPFEAEMLATRGSLKLWRDDLRGAVDDLSAVIGWARAGSAPRSLPNAYGALAEAEYRLGRWEEAQAHADVAVSLARDSDQVWELPFVHAVAAFLHAGRGDAALADEHVAAARHAAALAPLPLSVYYAAIARTAAAAAGADWTAVLDELESLSEHVPKGVAALVAARIGPLRCEALVESERIDEAGALLTGLEAELASSASDVTAVDLARLRGMLEQARGSHADARRAFEAGHAVAPGAGSTLAQAKLELAYGHFLRRSGRRTPALARLQVARGLFERLRARPLIARCDIELAACGARLASPHAAIDDYGLTEREQTVAGLVAAGKSNREVGEELYLSTKAIEYHLGNIFTKVGVRSRHQLASRLART